MTQATVVDTNIPESDRAGNSLGFRIRETMGDPPDVVIAFISPTYDQADVLRALKKSCKPKLLLGCSSSGEFTRQSVGDGMACAVAIRSDDMHFTAVLGRGLEHDLDGVARTMVASLKGFEMRDYRYRSGLVLVDSLHVAPEALLEQLTLLTDGSYQFFGGGAGDNFAFTNTSVFYDDIVINDAAVVLEILSNRPLGLGFRHGWVPISAPMQVTGSYGSRVISIEGRPPIEALIKHAKLTDQPFDLQSPVHFFLHNAIGIDTGRGYKLRGILRVNDDDSAICCADVPAGSMIQFMSASDADLVLAAEQATSAALNSLYGSKAAVALFFDCPVARYRMGAEFPTMLGAVQKVIHETPFIGCNTYGQLARTEGQFHGYMNCTPLVCLIPE